MKVIALAKKEAQDCINQPNLPHGCFCSDIPNLWNVYDVSDFMLLDKFEFISYPKVEMSNNIKNSSTANVYE